MDGARCVTEISGDDGRVVAVVHDPALRDDPMFLDVARASVMKALELERLSAALRSSLRELKDSRARIMSSADRERQRIERDLHDGAQQSLVALRIRLELAGELLRESPARAEQVLGELGTEVDAALEQVRSLARGVYPSLLADRGLREALRAAALRNPVRTTVDMDGIGRYRPEVEAAVYFCCLEAIQNAMKHAGGVETISISLAEDGDLRFEVRDDGAGFTEDDVHVGRGTHQHARPACGRRGPSYDPKRRPAGDECLRESSAGEQWVARGERSARRRFDGGGIETRLLTPPRPPRATCGTMPPRCRFVSS